LQGENLEGFHLCNLTSDLCNSRQNVYRLHSRNRSRTTNSLVAYMQGDVPVVIPGEDGLNLVPSVVALTLDNNENNQIVVGNAARKYLIETRSAPSTPSNA